MKYKCVYCSKTFTFDFWQVGIDLINAAKKLRRKKRAIYFFNRYCVGCKLDEMAKRQLCTNCFYHFEIEKDYPGKFTDDSEDKTKITHSTCKYFRLPFAAGYGDEVKLCFIHYKLAINSLDECEACHQMCYDSYHKICYSHKKRTYYLTSDGCSICNTTTASKLIDLIQYCIHSECTQFCTRIICTTCDPQKLPSNKKFRWGDFSRKYVCNNHITQCWSCEKKDDDKYMSIQDIPHQPRIVACMGCNYTSQIYSPLISSLIMNFF